MLRIKTHRLRSLLIPSIASEAIFLEPSNDSVEAWAEIHREELLRDWDLLQSSQPPLKIEPLH
jgi:hypothetical protein